MFALVIREIARCAFAAAHFHVGYGVLQSLWNALHQSDEGGGVGGSQIFKRLASGCQDGGVGRTESSGARS